MSDKKILVLENRAVAHVKTRIHPRFLGQNREEIMKLKVNVCSFQSERPGVLFGNINDVYSPVGAG